MAKMRVRCPACDSDLELDESFEGQEVECGSCLHVFVARYNGPASAGRPPASKIPGAGAPPRRPRADDEDEDDERDIRPRGKRPAPAEDEDGPDDDRRARPKPKPAADEPLPRRPLPRQNEEHRDYRNDDDEVEFDDDELDGPPPRGPNVSNGLATASLVIGIVSVFLVLATLRFSCCCVLLPLPLVSPLALVSVVCGGLGLRAESERKPLAVVGLILGLMSLIYIVLQLSFGIVPEQNPAP